MENKLKEKGAILDEQHLNSKNVVSNEIVKLLADNNFTIAEAQDVIRAASHKLLKQAVKVYS